MRNSAIGRVMTARGSRAEALAVVLLAGLVVAVAGAAASAQDRITLWRTVLARPSAVPSPGPLARLGRDLFRDPRISADGTMACATCHDLDRAFTDGRSRARSRTRGHLLRNTPTLLDIAAGERFNWDGSAASLAAQLVGPVTSPHELAGSLQTFALRLGTDPSVRRRFERVTGAEPTVASITSALVAYQRSLTSPHTRFDAWVAGDDGALTPLERAGLDLFLGRAACVTCHGTWRFTDGKLHDIGLEVPSGGRTAFKTPTLRELRRTGPYMHDGRFATVRDAVAHYARGIIERGTLSPNLRPRPQLTDTDVRALTAFVMTLSAD